MKLEPLRFSTEINCLNPKANKENPTVSSLPIQIKPFVCKVRSLQCSGCLNYRRGDSDWESRPLHQLKLTGPFRTLYRIAPTITPAKSSKLKATIVKTRRTCNLYCLESSQVAYKNTIPRFSTEDRILGNEHCKFLFQCNESCEASWIQAILLLRGLFVLFPFSISTAAAWAIQMNPREYSCCSNE